jgi:hypothetical protein
MFHPPSFLGSVEFLFKSDEFSDLVVFGKPVHRCIIHARCPKFFKIEFSNFKKSVVNSVIYTASNTHLVKLDPGKSQDPRILRDPTL